MASLVLGSAASCGGDGGDGDDGPDDNGAGRVDVSASRQQRIARQVCATSLSCNTDEGPKPRQSDCEDFYGDYFDLVEQEFSEDCFDLFLDYMDCKADLACDQSSDVACKKEEDALDAQCETFDPSEYSSSALLRSTVRLR
jgi:hypothetical protein